MTVATVTWRKSALYTNTTTNIASVLSSIKDAVDAEVAANPSTYQWAVADYSAVDGTLVLKPRSPSTLRLMFYGGSSPHTDATDGAAAASTSLYVGLAVNPGVDAPQQAYTAGAPFTTNQWLSGGLIAAASNISGNSWAKLEYWEHVDGFLLVIRKNTMNSGTTNANSALGWGGKMAVSADGQTAYSICGGSTGGLSSTLDTVTAAGGGIPFSNGTESTTTNSRNNFYESETDVIRRCQCLFKPRAAGLALKLRDAGNRRYFPPIYMVNSNEDRLMIKMRQMAWGVDDAHGTTYSDVDGIKGHRVGFRDDTASPGFWLTNMPV